MIRQTLWVAVWVALLTGSVVADVAIGIDGRLRVGRWTPVRVDDVDAGGGAVSVTTRDGEAVETTFHTETDGSTGYARFASATAGYRVTRGDVVVGEGRWDGSGPGGDDVQTVSTRTPWVVALGDALGIDDSGVSVLRRRAAVAVSRPDAGELPDRAIGYDGVDLILVTASADGLDTMADRQRSAIVDHVRGGGRMLVTLGAKTSATWRSLGVLDELLPIEPPRTVTFEPAAVETFTASQTPLERYDGASLPPDVGKVLLAGRTTRRVTRPVAVRYQCGFGSVTLVAADLDVEPFAGWSQRTDLINRLTDNRLVADDSTEVRRSTAYDDMAGQIRAALDRPSAVRRPSFAVLALILLGLVGVVGPLDYVVVRRIGRGAAGWLTFLAVAGGLSALLGWWGTRRATAIETASDGDGGNIERVEVTDVDAATGFGRTSVIENLIAARATTVDATLTPTGVGSWIGAADPGRSFLTPLVYVGASFGGLGLTIEDDAVPGYRVGLGDEPKVVGLPVPAGGSKTLHGVYGFEWSPGGDVVVPGRRAGTELLSGPLVNPLPVELRDAKLFYGNWSYLLPTRFAPGGRIGDVDELRQRNLRALLGRRRSVSGSVVEDYDPSPREDVDRIVTLAMFHRAGGGEGYTGLRQFELSTLDLSDSLTSSQCVLVGRVDRPLTQLSGVEPSDRAGGVSYVRVLLPLGGSAR